MAGDESTSKRFPGNLNKKELELIKKNQPNKSKSKINWKSRVGRGKPSQPKGSTPPKGMPKKKIRKGTTYGKR